MSRDPDRIKPFLRELEAFWRARPDWRFGQLIMNLSRDGQGGFLDIWEWDWNPFSRRMQEIGREESDALLARSAEAAVKRIERLERVEKAAQAVRNDPWSLKAHSWLERELDSE